MTTKEARDDIVENGINLGAGDFVDVEALRVAVVALDKRIPKKPIEKADEGFAPEVSFGLYCPTCGRPVYNYWVRGAKPKHCQFCGQALDWGKEAKT